MFQDFTVKGFVDELGSDSPAPGGGSTSAFAASLGSALASMVFHLTIGKKMYQEYSEEVQSLLQSQLVKAEAFKAEFLHLMDKDTDAFMEVMAAFKLPKETDEEKAVRSAKIQEGYKSAIAVPLEMATKAFEIFDILDTAVTYGNKNAISDAAVGALMTMAGMEGAIFNVKINLSSIKDMEYKNDILQQCETLLTEGNKKKANILSIVEKEIGC